MTSHEQMDHNWNQKTRKADQDDVARKSDFSVEWNKRIWDGGYDWEAGGEEWSLAWGSSEAQWYGSIYPRIRHALPSPRTLEIGMGYGRWTVHLLRDTYNYVGIDLSRECISACNARFDEDRTATFRPTDGYSIPSGTFDFVFSFDSLVHAEADVLEAYIQQILASLSDTGRVFIHHSNAGAFGENLPGEHAASRARSVSASIVRNMIERHGGQVLIQEILDWMECGKIDAVTTFCKHADDTPPLLIDEGSFMQEAARIRSTINFYCLNNNNKQGETKRTA